MLKIITNFIRTMDAYLEVDLNNLPKLEIKKIRGIYFLYKGSKLVYIGSSQNILDRVPKHLKNKKFDSFKYLEINGNVAKVESEFIRKYKPYYNIAVLYGNNKKVKEKISKTIRKRVKGPRVLEKMNTYELLNKQLKELMNVEFIGYKDRKRLYQ